MISSFNFFICKHPIDGMRLAIRTFPAEVEKRLVLLPRDAGASSLFLGHWCQPDYTGLPGLLRFDVEQLAVLTTQEGLKTHIVLSNPALEQSPFSELLDRLRLRLSTWQTINVVLFYNAVPHDLPPLRETDSVLCAWNIHDAMDDETLESLRMIRERVQEAGCKFVGPALYTRAGLEDNSTQDLFDRALSKLPDNAPSTLMKL